MRAERRHLAPLGFGGMERTVAALTRHVSAFAPSVVSREANAGCALVVPAPRRGVAAGPCGLEPVSEPRQPRTERL